MDPLPEVLFNTSDVDPSNRNCSSRRENFDLLKAMGFIDETEIQQALDMSKNDINEAVSILTNEKLPKFRINNSSSDQQMQKKSTSNHNFDDAEVVMTNDSNSNPNSPNSSSKNKSSISNLDSIADTSPSNLSVFPYDCLAKLENSVFTDNWSIPYKKDEWLDKLLKSSIYLAKEGLADEDQNCKQFLERVVPEVFKKLLDASAVKNWNSETQHGVYNMASLCIELISLKLLHYQQQQEQENVSCSTENQAQKTTSSQIMLESLLITLDLIFRWDCEFHSKNAAKIWDKEYFIQLFGGLENCYSKDLDKYGWLLNFINFVN